MSHNIEAEPIEERIDVDLLPDTLCNSLLKLYRVQFDLLFIRFQGCKSVIPDNFYVEDDATYLWL